VLHSDEGCVASPRQSHCSWLILPGRKSLAIDLRTLWRIPRKSPKPGILLHA